jgi:UDPglucose 6-dehydrogenase
MRIGIVGHGIVGSAMSRFFPRNPSYAVTIYDKFRPPYDTDQQLRRVNESDLVFLCVPTPTAADGASCDVSIVEECVSWIEPPICIRSTIVPGTADRLSAQTGKAIAFSPEYLGEHPDHPWHEECACGFAIVGGPPDLCDLVLSAFGDVHGAGLKTYRTTAATAELCKYMENCFLATKVAFVNQFFDIASAFEVDFGGLRELWLADSREGESHSRVTAERGFRGKCLPKDMSALATAMQPLGGAPLLEAIIAYNARVCENADRLAGE